MHQLKVDFAPISGAPDDRLQRITKIYSRVARGVQFNLSLLSIRRDRWGGQVQWTGCERVPLVGLGRRGGR